MMPYIDGQRVSNQEWQDRYSTLEVLKTGANGANPAADPELDEETQAPKVKPKGRGRSVRSEAGAKAAIADAMGTKDADTLSAIDVSGLDADTDDEDKED